MRISGCASYFAANKNCAAYNFYRDMWRSSPCTISTQGILQIGDDSDSLSDNGAMLTALILVCPLTVTPDLRACTSEKATIVTRVPDEFGNPVTYLINGQAYIAETSIGQNLAGDDRIKIICGRSETIDESTQRPATK